MGVRWPYCEAKAERQEGMSGIAVWENGKVSAYQLGLGLMMLFYLGEAWKAAICCGDGRRRRRTPRMYRVSLGMRWALRAQCRGRVRMLLAIEQCVDRFQDFVRDAKAQVPRASASTRTVAIL
ncbi:UNVERIFIED_CONTAM: hypothetical protein Sindi_2000500 [Sesamum indicum]